MADTKISELAAASALTTSDYFPVVQSGTTKKAALSESQLINLAYPIGSGTVYSAPVDAYAVSGGATMPEVGAYGAFLAFDQATTEGCAFRTDRHPQTWRTFDIYLAAFNLTGGTGDVVWRVNVNDGGDVDTTCTYSAPLATTHKLAAQTFSFATSWSIGGTAYYGAKVVLSRVGGNAADTLAGDIHLGSLVTIRVT